MANIKEKVPHTAATEQSTNTYNQSNYTQFSQKNQSYVMGLIEEARRKVNRNYTMRTDEMQVIYEMGPNTWNVMCNAFLFGYLKGQRALRAEIKRSQARDCTDRTITKQKGAQEK
ncbi:hypothetical protein WGC32_13755 [Zongyangia sp. HA2173]|uniref:hypothetical protein n=1 Tax=Zongyangia sp. HA2173 TaxID=3133035 RepID=UPI003165CD88